MADLTEEDDALLAELGVEIAAKKVATHTPREERILAGFAEIQRFVETHGHLPRHGEEHDIFERLYAVRLDRLRAQEDCRALLAPLDPQRLLEVSEVPALDDDQLLEALGASTTNKLEELKHVRSAADKKAAEEIANRKTCEDFANFRAAFTQIKEDLDTGVRQTVRFQKNATIEHGQWFIVEGQIAYVAGVGEEFLTEYNRKDSRLRVIYDNGTESDVLRRSLQRALYRDGAGRRITELDSGPLFSAAPLDSDDLESGTIYVVRTCSDDPALRDKREILHKIGVTGDDVERRLASARRDPTFLMADVELVASYRLFNIHRIKLERLLHRVFARARLDVSLNDRFGTPIAPREWFLVPLPIIDEAVRRIEDGSIVNYLYDPHTAALVAT